MSFFNVFARTTRSGDSWFSAGPSSAYPNIIESGSVPLSDQLPCQDSVAPGCKVFHVPSDDSSKATEIEQNESEGVPAELKDQVVVFQYQGNFHAIDHSCPHSSYPLSKGTPFDIEDFGVRLSAGIRCPKHDWSFDLVRGNGDRGNYRLKIWEVQLRPMAEGGINNGEESKAKEVWVRRKQRIG